jgi:hypothetical protein
MCDLLGLSWDVLLGTVSGLCLHTWHMPLLLSEQSFFRSVDDIITAGPHEMSTSLWVIIK